MEGKKPFKLVA